MKDSKTTSPLDIFIIGANGGVGKQAVTTALQAGHRVTALLRNPANLTLTHPKLQIVKGDIMRSYTFEKYLEYKDVVISAIGNNMNKPTTLYSEGSRNLIQAMKRMGVDRAFFISAAAIEISPAQSFVVRLLTKYVIQKLFGHGYADQRIMERLIKESDINFTIVRPPKLNNKPQTGNYRYAVNSFLKNCLSISRADVAHFMINNIHNEDTFKATVEIAY